jgi:hypothetical protein
VLDHSTSFPSGSLARPPRCRSADGAALIEERVLEDVIRVGNCHVAEAERHDLGMLPSSPHSWMRGVGCSRPPGDRRNPQRRFDVDQIRRVERRQVVAGDTAATGSPTKRTRSTASACSSWLTGRMP